MSDPKHPEDLDDHDSIPVLTDVIVPGRPSMPRRSEMHAPDVEAKAEAPAAEPKAEAPPAAETKAEAPAAEPKAAAPAVEPKAEASAAEPKVAVPAAEPKAAAPAAEPKVAAPAVEPKVAAPAAEPKVAVPAVEPKAAAPAVEPKVAAPAAEPTVAAPAAALKAEAPAAELKAEAPAAETNVRAPAAQPEAEPLATPHKAEAPAEPPLTSDLDQSALQAPTEDAVEASRAAELSDFVEAEQARVAVSPETRRPHEPLQHGGAPEPDKSGAPPSASPVRVQTEALTERDAEHIAERLRARFAGYLREEGRRVIESRCRDALEEHTSWLVRQVTREVALVLEGEVVGWVRDAVREELAAHRSSRR